MGQSSSWAREDLPASNGKAGIIGSCSGGRHALLAAFLVPGFEAVGDLWGGGVVMTDGERSEARPVAPIDYTARLTAPLLGLFGNDDTHPSPEQVNLQRGGGEAPRQDVRVLPL